MFIFPLLKMVWLYIKLINSDLKMVLDTDYVYLLLPGYKYFYLFLAEDGFAYIIYSYLKRFWLQMVTAGKSTESV